MDIESIQIIPAEIAVYCLDCRSITNSTGHSCAVCASPAIANVLSWIESKEEIIK